MEKDTQTTVEKIIKTILAGIENGTFPPGSALPAQRQLAEYFDVSRNAIREAVKVLEGSGVLYSKRGSGIYVRNVANPTTEDGMHRKKMYTLQQILDLCRYIWHSSMSGVVKNASEEELKRVQRRNQKLQDTYSTLTIQQKFIYESSFGMNIVQLSGNPLVNDLMRELLKATTEIDYKIISKPDYKKILEIDSLIIEALLSRDIYRAFFLGNERDLVIESLISDCEELMKKTYAIYI